MTLWTDDAGDPHLAVETRVLPCGLTVLLHRDASAPQIAASIWYRVGSSDERPDRTGFAHLFEHLFKQPPERFGGFHHYDVLKRAGAADANASTSADRTAYHEVVPANQLPLALWLESDRMGYFAAGFTAERLATQQSVVRQERRQRYEDVPYGAERLAMGLALYPEGHPLRHLTIGRHDDIQAATPDDVLDFYRTWYVPANATLVLAGDLPASLDDLLARYFGTFPSSSRPPRAQPVAPVPSAPLARVDDRFAALGRIHRAYLGPRALTDDEAALDLLAQAWSQPGTGALWRRLVYDERLAQKVSAWTVNGRLGGEFHIAVDLQTGTDPARVRAILDEETARLPDTQAIARAATRTEAAAVWSLTSLGKRANLLQRYALYGAGAPGDALAAELARYRAADLPAAHARYLTAPPIEIETVPHTNMT
ncbi:MAG TPA: pitrilysin family protein [Kofleriaceae bacterium]